MISNINPPEKKVWSLALPFEIEILAQAFLIFGVFSIFQFAIGFADINWPSEFHYLAWCTIVTFAMVYYVQVKGISVLVILFRALLGKDPFKEKGAELK